MKKLLNTLYVTSNDIFLKSDNDNIVVIRDGETVQKIPALGIESIITFSNLGFSSGLIDLCSRNHIDLCLMNYYNGRFIARIQPETYGNIFLRKTQYSISSSTIESLSYSKNFIYGKIYNQIKILQRFLRDHPLSLNVEKVNVVIDSLKGLINEIPNVSSSDKLKSIEGMASKHYFTCFNSLIIQQRDDFIFTERSKRPPLDILNALLSFTYSIATNRCKYALESVGLDPFSGFLHTDRPGRASLACDLVEELRSFYCDRFVLTLINKKIVTADDFNKSISDAVSLSEEGRRKFFKYWQEKMLEEIEHPFLHEKVKYGLIPYTQALLLSRSLRGNLDGYPPFLYR